MRDYGRASEAAGIEALQDPLCQDQCRKGAVPG